MSVQDRNFRAYPQIDVIRDTIQKANGVSLLHIFNHYKINITQERQSICCPFPSHRDDKTPSFHYYSDARGFYCFGCKTGGNSSDFVASMEDITRYVAAKKILENFEGNVSEVFEPKENLFKYHIDFSHIVRNFRDEHKNNHAELYADDVGRAFDAICAKYNLDSENIQKVINKFKQKLRDYKCPPHLL